MRSGVIGQRSFFPKSTSFRTCLGTVAVPVLTCPFLNQFAISAANLLKLALDAFGRHQIGSNLAHLFAVFGPGLIAMIVSSHLVHDARELRLQQPLDLRSLKLTTTLFIAKH